MVTAKAVELEQLHGLTWLSGVRIPPLSSTVQRPPPCSEERACPESQKNNRCGRETEEGVSRDATPWCLQVQPAFLGLVQRGHITTTPGNTYIVYVQLQRCLSVRVRSLNTDPPPGIERFPRSRRTR